MCCVHYTIHAEKKTPMHALIAGSILYYYPDEACILSYFNTLLLLCHCSCSHQERYVSHNHNLGNKVHRPRGHPWGPPEDRRTTSPGYPPQPITLTCIKMRYTQLCGLYGPYTPCLLFRHITQHFCYLLAISSSPASYLAHVWSMERSPVATSFPAIR